MLLLGLARCRGVHRTGIIGLLKVDFRGCAELEREGSKTCILTYCIIIVGVFKRGNFLHTELYKERASPLGS